MSMDYFNITKKRNRNIYKTKCNWSAYSIRMRFRLRQVLNPRHMVVWDWTKPPEPSLCLEMFVTMWFPFFKNYLCNRSQKVRIGNNVSERVSICTGVPQYQNLSFQQQVNNIAQKCSSTLKLLYTNRESVNLNIKKMSMWKLSYICHELLWSNLLPLKEMSHVKISSIFSLVMSQSTNIP